MTFLNNIRSHFWRNRATALAVGVFLLPLLPACQRPDEVSGPLEEDVSVGEGAGVNGETGTTGEVDREPFTVAQQVEENVELDELAGNVEDYVGRRISVRGESANAVEESGFLLQSDSWFGGQEVLAINATGQPIAIPDDTELQVTGEVRQFVIADVEQEFGLTLDRGVYADYEQKPVIIAESVALSPEPDEVTEDPTQFYNQVIAVEGDIGEFVSPGVFRLEEERLFGGEGLLVLSNVAEMTEAAMQNGEVDEDSRVVVTGVLRPYVRAEFERDYDLWNADVLGKIEAEYERQPVLVAREVYASAE